MVVADVQTNDPLVQLGTAAQFVAELESTSDAVLGYFVDQCRKAGLTWSEISSGLGVSRQAVHKRFAASPAAGLPRVGPDGFEAITAPADEQTLAGQFQLRCRELIGEMRSLGFDPTVWVPMINRLGALGAAKKLLADHHRLVATPWLVERGRADLTLEHEIGEARWVELFTDEEREEAARRLAAAENTRS